MSQVNSFNVESALEALRSTLPLSVREQLTNTVQPSFSIESAEVGPNLTELRQTLESRGWVSLLPSTSPRSEHKNFALKADNLPSKCAVELRKGFYSWNAPELEMLAQAPANLVSSGRTKIMVVWVPAESGETAETLWDRFDLARQAKYGENGYQDAGYYAQNYAPKYGRKEGHSQEKHGYLPMWARKELRNAGYKVDDKVRPEQWTQAMELAKALKAERAHTAQGMPEAPSQDDELIEGLAEILNGIEDEDWLTEEPEWETEEPTERMLLDAWLEAEIEAGAEAEMMARMLAKLSPSLRKQVEAKLHS